MRACTVAVIDDTNRLIERVTYDAYGKARHHPRWDIDRDGTTDGDDYSMWAAFFPTLPSIGDAAYNADADPHRDGGYAPSDSVQIIQGINTPSLPRGFLSSLDYSDNRVGYAGYLRVDEAQLYCVRFRHYDDDAGRWMQRDMLDYIDGTANSSYVRLNPLRYVDRLGAAAVDPTDPGFEIDIGRPSANQIAAYLDALRKLCPMAEIYTKDGRVAVTLNVTNPKTGVVYNKTNGKPHYIDVADPKDNDGDSNAEECSDPCGNPPGCDIIRRLADLLDDDFVTYLRKKSGGDISYNVYTPGTKILAWSPWDETKQITEIGGGRRTRESWELLWHEMIHAYRHRTGEYLGPGPQEEVETITKMNEMRAWYRECGGENAGRITDRDPHSHKGFADK